MKVQVEFQELDKKKKVMRIIAREGLALAAILIVSFLVYLHASDIAEFWLKARYKLDILDAREGSYAIRLCESFRQNITVSSYLLYPAYLIIRFIIWAIKTLKEK